MTLCLFQHASYLDSHLATFSPTITYTYSQRGNYTIHVAAVNSVSQVHDTIEISVYGKCMWELLIDWCEGLGFRIPSPLLS